MSSPLPPGTVRVLSVSTAEELARELARTGCAEAAVRLLVPKGMFHAVRIEDVPAEAANLLKMELLAAGGDAAIHQEVLTGTIAHSAVVLLGTEAQLRRLCEQVEQYPLGLPAIAAAIRAVLPPRPPIVLHCGRYALPLGAKTYVMGILNMTPDSFSGEGLGNDVDRAVRQAEIMLNDGADILDIGGESTRPGAEEVPLAEELRRVIPVIAALAARFEVPLSVDTYKSVVAREAVAAGATLLNDISGLRFDPALAAVAAEAHLPVVVMHIKGTPRSMQQHPAYTDLLTEVCDYLRASTEIAVAAGIPRDQVILDPGFGFGKTVAHNLELLRRLHELTSFGQPVLLGTSRKSTIGKVLGDLPPDERVEGTAATVALGIANGADIVRVHDVKEMVRVARMTDAVVRV